MKDIKHGNSFIKISIGENRKDLAEYAALKKLEEIHFSEENYTEKETEDSYVICLYNESKMLLK